jgi:hypothetical protein
MGYIKEPKGVDFIIKSEPLSDEERSAISKFIADYKKKGSIKKGKPTVKAIAKKKNKALLT